MKSLRAVGLLFLAACGGSGDLGMPDGGMTHTDSGGGLPTEAPADSKIAYEGYERFVTTITGGTHDMTGATIVPAPGEAALEVVATQCNNVRCAVHLRVRDTISEITAPDPVPAPIALSNHFLDVQTVDGAPLRATIGVFPTHTVGAHDVASVHDSILISGGVVDPGVVLKGAPIGGPPRWYSMGALRVAGTLDVSPRDDVSTVTTMQVTGGGGGGNGTAGVAGEGPTGTAGAGGTGGPASADATLACLINPVSIGCGGGGGGGAAGVGGPGGGGIFIVSLEPLDLGGGTLFANGADGAMGAGGGAGGNIFVAAPAWTAPVAMLAAAGHGATQSGGGRGGDGADGRLRVDIPGVTVGGAWSGPVVDPTGVPLFTDQATLVLGGRGTPMAVVQIDHVEHGSVAAPVVGTVAADGTFSVTAVLAPGTNRLRVTELVTGAGRVQGWIGNSFEFGTDTCITHAVCVPKGALLDVAYVPAAE